MTNEKGRSVLPDWLNELGSIGMPELSDRETACLVISDLDYESQLVAIRQLLRRNRQADEDLQKEIERIGQFARNTTGLRNEYAVDEWTDHLHYSVYHDAAHSMAAVGMLAPLVESLFSEAFQGIRCHMQQPSQPPSDHERWQQSVNDQWDCHFVWRNGRRSTDLVAGIVQLVEAVGLNKHMPVELEPTLKVLFAYRNKMFHCGFEWPVTERRRFAERIASEEWPSDWFSQATSGDEPWVFYMSDKFIQHCLKTIDEVIEGIGAFCKAQFMSTVSRPEGMA